MDNIAVEGGDFRSPLYVESDSEVFVKALKGEAIDRSETSLIVNEIEALIERENVSFRKMFKI